MDQTVIKPTETHTRRWETTVAYGFGALMVLSGVFHVMVWTLDGGGWSGPVSWRKPILFGLSTGVTVISVGWVAAQMRRRAVDPWLISALAVGLTLEVALITLQQWRGVASHFNRSTLFDATLLTATEILVVSATLVIADYTRRSFGPLAIRGDQRSAIRGGMSLLLFACLLGFVLIAYGNQRAATGGDPSTYGKAGVMKFPHGVPIHAIQFLPFLAWLLTRLSFSESVRRAAVRYAVASIVAFTAFSLLQTFTGRGRFEFWWWSYAVLVLAGLLALTPSVLVLLGAWRKVTAGKPSREPDRPVAPDGTLV